VTDHAVLVDDREQVVVRRRASLPVLPPFFL
jgi:hypothetical protein